MGVFSEKMMYNNSDTVPIVLWRTDAQLTFANQGNTLNAHRGGLSWFALQVWGKVQASLNEHSHTTDPPRHTFHRMKYTSYY